MKKILSILLSVLLLLSTMTVLTILPAVATTPESEPVNLIVNGDGNGIDTDSDGKVDKTSYTDDDKAASTYTGEFDKGAPIGWRDLSEQYANTKLFYPHTFGNLPSGYYSNYSKTLSIGLNQGQTLVQDIMLEAGKSYQISAKIAANVITNGNQTGTTVSMFVDGKSNMEAASAPSNVDWVTVKTFTFEATAYDYAEDGETVTKTYYSAGDFTDHQITFNADDFAKANNLTAVDGKYSARLVFKSTVYGSAYTLYDDITMYEVYNITADKGGYVNTNAVFANKTATIAATPYYGNGFAGWYNGDKLVSTSATYTGIITSDLTAKFNVYNQIVDGDFESGTDVGLSQFTDSPRYTTLDFKPTFETPTGSTASKHGKYCIEINSTDASQASNRQLLNLPVTIEKNKEYYFEYFVYLVGVPYTNADETVVKAFNTHFAPKVGTIGWNTISLSQFKSYTYTFYGEASNKNNTNVYSWNGTAQAATSYLTVDTRMVNTIDNWVCVRLLFNSGENEDIFGTSPTATLNLQIGFAENANHDIRLDNIFFGESTKNANMTATAGGTVSTATTVPMHYKSTAYGSLPSETDYTVSYYPAKANEYTAVADTGYRFAGWYDGDTLVSSNATEIFYSGKNYTAKFEPVPTYTITASAEKNADGIYGGYVINKSQVINEAENVTVSAVTYAGNTFEGWYNGETKVSSNESYTFTVASDVDLVAKWNVENIWPDSGYENTEVGVQQISHRNPEGMWHSAGNPWNWGYASVTTDYKYTGNASMAVTHRQNEVSAKLSVEPNTDYELSFNWLLGNAHLAKKNPNDPNEELRPSYLNYILIRGWDSSQIGYTDVTTYYSAEFQNTKVIFNSGDNSEVFIGFNYFAGSQPIYLDDVCLVPYDKETGTTDYFRVTYNFGVEEMENATEYVKAGEYTLRAGNFFFREPISVDFVNYTVNGEAKAAGDAITVDGDVTVYMNYKAHDYGDMLTDTTNFGNDYELVLAALPDPQKLLVHHTDYYGMIGDWLLSKKNDISGIIALGDLTEYGGWPQYEAVYDTFKEVVAEMPFGVSLGNHDYPGGNGKGDWADNYEKEYNTIIYDHFFKDIIVDSLLANNGGAYPYTNVATDKYEAMSKDAKVESVEHTYYIYNDEYLVISLGIFPRDEVLDWADALAKANADKKVIVTTHSHIGKGGQILDDDDTYAIAKNETTNGGTVVREKLLETNPNIIMMVCGHASSTDTIYNRNIRADGTTYYEVLIDNQDDDENWQGVGNVTLLGFKDDGTVDFTTYSTVQQAYFNSANNEFSIELGAHRNSDVVEDVEENTVIDTSAVDTNDYFIPYGALYYTDENGDIKYVDKDADGKFTAPVAGKFNFTSFKKPAFGKLLTFGASANPTDGTVQYGSYIESIAEGTKYGTMFITGDWDAFVKYYQDNKAWTVDEIVAKVSAMYDSNIEASTTGNVAISAGSDIVVFAYKVDQSNYMYRNENGVLEFALRVIGLAADRTCTAVGYAKTENGCEFSENIISTSFNKLVGAN